MQTRCSVSTDSPVQINLMIWFDLCQWAESQMHIQKQTPHPKKEEKNSDLTKHNWIQAKEEEIIRITILGL